MLLVVLLLVNGISSCLGSTWELIWKEKQPAYKHTHALLHTSDSSHCRKVHVLKGENAKEPDVHLCLDHVERGSGAVFSFGIANNWIFDDFMIRQGCRVFSFDPSMTQKRHKRGPDHLFEPIGIGTKDGTWTGESTLYGKKTNYPVLTLETMMRTYNVSYVDVLRMDVESAEWDVLEQWLDRSWFQHIGQLLLEIHMWQRKDEARHTKILHAVPMKMFHTARNRWDGTRLHGDMTRVHEIGWITHGIDL